MSGIQQQKKNNNKELMSLGAVLLTLYQICSTKKGSNKRPGSNKLPG